MHTNMRRLAIAATIISVTMCTGVAAAQDEILPFGRRIVGGEMAYIKDHPWQVALSIKIEGGTYLCGGALIADRWVLTAAHCFTDATKPLEVRAKTRATNLATDGTWTGVQKIVVHEGYAPKTQEHDLALVKLSDAPKGHVIPLVTASANIPLGTPLEVTGWGATSENGRASPHLRKASVPYASNETCNAPEVYRGAIKRGMMCAGRREGGVDSCQGDSGGPLVWRSPDGALLVGVVSWGEGCARKLRYGVYTRVTAYREWIEEVISPNMR